MTYRGLLLNFKSFTSFSYKSDLIKCLIDKSFNICNNGNCFLKDIENIKCNLIKNVYPPFLIDKVIKKYLDHKFSSNQSQLKDTSDSYYFKLPYISNFSQILTINFWNFAKNFVMKTLTWSYFLIHSKLEVIFHMKTQFLMIWNLS